MEPFRLSLYDKNTILSFSLCFFLFLIAPGNLTQFNLTYFAPFLIVVIYKNSKLRSLGLAFSTGLILDLFSTLPHFGLLSLNYTLTMAWIYNLQRHFFADSLTTLPIMTFLFCSISSAILAALMFAIEGVNIVSKDWIAIDLILMPLLDAAYAFTFFILPPFLISRLLKKRREPA